jgi:hypothetical protein
MACSSSHVPSSTDGSLGAIEATLTAIGPDGATYSIPPSITFVVTPFDPTNPAADAGASFTLAFDGTSPTQSFSLPAGSYHAQFNNPTGNTYTLTRAGDGGATTAQATLLDVQPFTFTVTPQTTTPLTFHFDLLSLGPVTFGTGTLQIAMQVDAGEGGPPSSVTLGGLVGVNAPTPGKGNPGGNPGITGLLTAGAPAEFSIKAPPLPLAGQFVAGVDSICAPLSMGVVGPVGLVQPAGGGSSVTDLFNEATVPAPTGPASGQICFYDQNGYTIPADPFQNSPAAGPIPYAVVITFTRTGKPTTASVTAALADAGVASGTFKDTIIGQQFSPPVYDGTTANFAVLAQPVTVTFSSTTITFDPGAMDEVVAQGFGNVGGQTTSLTVQVSP